MSTSLFMVSKYNNLIVFFIFFGALQSIGIGIVYMSPISIAANYYPEYKGSMTGILLGFYGLSGIMIQTLFN